MARLFRFRPVAFTSSLVALALLLSASADAQRKKAPRRKKPAVTAKPKPAAPPPAAPAPAAPAAPPNAPAEELPPEPTEKSTKPPTSEGGEEKPLEEQDREQRQKERDKEKEAKEKAMPPILDLSIGIKGFQRHLSYDDDVNNALPNYDLSGAPAFTADIGLYPIRSSSISAGVTGSFEQGFAMGSTYRVPQPGQEGTHATTASAFAVGARLNFHFGLSSIGVGVEYGGQSFAVDLPPPTLDNAGIPDVEYRFIRPNLTGRFGFSDKFALLAGLGYLYLLSAGEIVSADYFRGGITSASGFDLNLGIAYGLPASGFLGHIELRPMLGVRRYTYKFTPDPMIDPYYATGATDDYYSLGLSFALRL
ncbi:MAG TPA: hypothetical protein VF881_04675 [Polyangiaceae bacterium]